MSTGVLSVVCVPVKLQCLHSVKKKHFEHFLIFNFVTKATTDIVFVLLLTADQENVCLGAGDNALGLVLGTMPWVWLHEKVPVWALQKQSHPMGSTRVGATCFGRVGELHETYLDAYLLGATHWEL